MNKSLVTLAGFVLLSLVVTPSYSQDLDPSRVFKKNPSHFDFLSPVCGRYQEGGAICYLQENTEDLIERARESFLENSQLRIKAYENELENVSESIRKLRSLGNNFSKKSEFLKDLYLNGAKVLEESQYRLALIEWIKENGADSELLSNLQLLTKINKEYKKEECEVEEREKICSVLTQNYLTILRQVNELQEVAYTNFRFLDYPVLENAEILSPESHFDHNLRNPFLEVKLYWPKGQALHTPSVYLIEDAELIERVVLDEKGNNRPLTIKEVKSGIWAPKITFNRNERTITHKYGLDQSGKYLPLKDGWKEYLQRNLLVK